MVGEVPRPGKPADNIHQSDKLVTLAVSTLHTQLARPEDLNPHAEQWAPRRLTLPPSL